MVLDCLWDLAAITKPVRMAADLVQDSIEAALSETESMCHGFQRAARELQFQRSPYSGFDLSVNAAGGRIGLLGLPFLGNIPVG